ncbi:MAG TPA: carboxypeptidase regulatory-like domain-containing protein [Bryobacteraceae bacterium]|nr:carboxypeptidase regulatory-like domain-containing protein [Bryobacteraceae bacterium]
MLLFSASLFGQGSFGRILGTVTDQTGAVLPGAMVTVLDTQRGLARTLTTDAAGEYNAPNLIPGTYTVRVEANGFKRLDRQNVALEVGQEVRVDLTPQPGDQTQTVTVSEAIPLVDTASATLGGTLNNADINDMPLNGRNYQNLLNLRPGVVIQVGGSPWTQSTNNIRPDETAWMLDGVINANFVDARPIANMPSPLTDGATILPVDAIQEFNLEENAKAEYGWKPGAVVNVGIRSGTNSYHGSAYAFGRYDGFDARNFFNQGVIDGTCAPNPSTLAVCDKLPTQLEQFGGVVGGPIKKDKLFFFAGYEGLRSLVGNAFGSSVPAIGPGLGAGKSAVDAIAQLQSRQIALSPVSMKLLGCTTGPVACTGGLIQGASAATTSYLSTFPNNNVSDNGIAKIDYRINDKNMINGMFWDGNYVGVGEDHAQVNAAFSIPIPITTKTLVANWVYTPNSRMVNEARYGWNVATFYQGVGDGNILADGTGGMCSVAGCGGKGYPINTGITSPGGLPDIKISPFGSYIGEWPNRPGGWGNPYWDFQDSVSYLMGKHALKFGGGYTNINVTTFTGNTSRGNILFSGGNAFAGSTGLEDFFAGDPTQGALLTGNGHRLLTSHAADVFIQDDWRLTQRFMLNLGLRWSFEAPFHAADNLFGNFDPSSPTGMVQQGDPGVGSTLYHTDYKDFSPRLGFAWDVTGKGTTVVRGGGSIMYSVLPSGRFTTQLALQDSTGTNVAADPTGACRTAVSANSSCPPGGTFGGTNVLGNFTYPGSALNWNGVVFPQGGGLSCTKKLPCNLMGVDPNFKTPYVASWNANVQHSFGNNLSLEVGYVANVGERLLQFIDVNEINPATRVRPYAAQFPYLKYINRGSNGAYSNFNSLQTTLTKRLSHGLSFLAGYTYGHGLDNGSLNSFGTLPQNSLAPGLEYASSDFDIRHRFTLTGSYEIPGKNGFGQILKGWKINSIVNWQTGQPWIAFDSQDNFSGSLDRSDRWDFFGNPGNYTSGSQSIPWCSGPGTNGCSVVSGVSGVQSFFSAAQSTAMWGQCAAVAPDPGTLGQAGCYVKGNGVLVPPKAGTFGTMGRNPFRDSGFQNVDFSIFKNFVYKERYNAQFRLEVFNLFNHPIIANPYGASNGAGGAGGGGNDMSNASGFGCGCSTPDVIAGNPLVGSGSSRVVQLGFKFTF